MAIALRGSAAVPTGNPTTSFTVAIPSQVASGDVLFLAITSRDHTAGTARVSVTDNDAGGNAWALMTGAESSDRKASVYWKRATGSTASKTITVSGAVGSSAGVLKCFSGVVDTTPFSNVAVETNASANETHAGFTPGQADSMVCASVHNYANDNAVSSLNFATLGATTATEKLSTGGNDCGCTYGHAVQSGAAAATGNLTWAQTDGTTYSITWAIIPALVPVTGSLSSTLGALAIAATAVLAVVGVLNTSVGVVASVATATIPIVGTSVSTLGSVDISSEGSVEDPTINASLGVTLGDVQAAAGGNVEVRGSVSATFADVIASGAGAVDVRGALSSAFADVSTSASGSIPISGQAAGTLGAVTVSADGQVALAGSLNQTLASLSPSGNAQVSAAGALSQSLDALLLEASGGAASPVTGILAAELALMTVSAGATVAVTGSVDVTLDTITVSATSRGVVSNPATHTWNVTYRRCEWPIPSRNREWWVA